MRIDAVSVIREETRLPLTERTYRCVPIASAIVPSIIVEYSVFNARERIGGEDGSIQIDNPAGRTLGDRLEFRNWHPQREDYLVF